MHVICIKDEQGDERNYVAELLEQTNDFIRFDFVGTEITVRAENVLEIVRVNFVDEVIEE